MNHPFNKSNRPEIINLLGFSFLGFLLNIQPIVLIFYFILLNVYYFYQYSKTFNVNILLNLLIFLPSIELLRRLTGLNTMPYEIGKYSCFIYFVLFSLDKRIHTKKIKTDYIILFLFLFPSILFTDMYHFRLKLVFNLLGILNLALLSIFFSRITLTIFEFKNLLKQFIYSLIPILIILTIRTPKFSEIKFNLLANYDASGGFGPNQVSTILGAAVLILIINQIVFKKNLFSSNKQIDLILTIAFSFRALLTFSRGGILAPIAASLFHINLLSKVQNIQKLVGRFIIIITFSGLVFLSVNSITDGALYLRYSGESTKSLSGTSEKSLESVSSGRSSIFEYDIDIWLDNFFFGVGPGESASARMKLMDGAYVAAHTEFSRLLAEHGLFGLIINILLLIVIPLKILNNHTTPQVKYIKLAFIIFAVFSMFHSAMRTVIPVIFYAMSAINFYEEKKEIT